MSRQDEFVKERLKKIEELRKAGINPYPYSYEKSDNASDLQKKYEKLKAEAKPKDKVKIAGRLMTVRDLGKIAFGVLQDGTGRIQIVLQEKETSESVRELFKKYVDAGDFIGVEGIVFRTTRGELSILVKKIEILSKSILPLPDKWQGIENDEEKLRKRYLDILMNQEVRDRFVRKSKFWQTVRNFLISKDFLEVETPVLENSAGGASATPFSTHHNALNTPVFLRISAGELWQKKLMVAGYEKTFEIGRIFRNEGMDAEHLQDYTQMEFYWAYVNYEEGMKLTEELYKEIATSVYGKTKFETSLGTADLSKPWKKIDYADTVKKETKIDIFKASTKDIELKLKELNQEFVPWSPKARLIDLLWKYCRKKILGPVFLTGQPVEVSPLAKRDADLKRVQQFQIIIGGTEIGNGYSELNDPIDQEERFEQQKKMKEAGDSEAQAHDLEFIEALKYGMPPTCGFGFSERLFAFFEGKPIRETVLFPLMKPLNVKKEKEAPVKAKESKIAVILINKAAKLAPWQQMNAVAHLTAAFGARTGKQLFLQDKINTKDSQEINLNIQHAIMIKEGTSSKLLSSLSKEGKDSGLEVADFTREMMETTNDKIVIDKTKEKNLEEVEYLGILLFGKRSEVESLTSKFKLLDSFK